MSSPPILEIENLFVTIKSKNGNVYPVQDISCKIYRGEKIGIAGESGSGKSIFALSVGNLLPPNTFSISAKKFKFQNFDLLSLDEYAWRKIRGTKIGYVFQESLVSLNPHLTIGTQLSEHLVVHWKLSKKGAFERAVNLLMKLQLSEPELRMKMYPHQLSGGMRQRVAIAMALILNPEIIIADEPTTALDATLQVQIIELLNFINKEYGTSVIFITHDLSLLANFCSHIWIMYGGKILESAPVEQIYRKPLHPYTRLLLSIRQNFKKGGSLRTIAGSPPSMKRIHTNCPFYDRCEFAKEICRTEPLRLLEVAPGHCSACVLIQKGEIKLES